MSPRPAARPRTPEPPRPRRTLHREDLLRSVADHVVVDGLHGFTLRRAAAAAATTHKVLLYHFGSAAGLISESLDLILEDVETAARLTLTRVDGDLQVRLGAIWRFWRDAPAVLTEALGLAMAEPTEFGDFGVHATRSLLVSIKAGLTDADLDTDLDAVATLVLAVLRGLTIDRGTTGDNARCDAAFAAFTAALAASTAAERSPADARG